MKKIALTAFKPVASAPSKPVMPYDTSEVDKIIKLDGEIKSKTAELKLSKDNLIADARNEWYRINSYSSELKSSMLVEGSEADGAKRFIMVTASNRYPSVDESTLDAFMANEAEVVKNKNLVKLVKEQFVPTWSLSIKSDAIPEKQHQAFVDALQAMVIKLGLDPAQVVEVKEQIKPKDSFHETRHKLPASMNRRLDEICPATFYVKVDGVKGS